MNLSFFFIGVRTCGLRTWEGTGGGATGAEAGAEAVADAETLIGFSDALIIFCKFFK
jgi:hypothetical protein